MTLYGGMLNVVPPLCQRGRAPIFLNLSMMMALALAAFFSSAGHAAAWGAPFSGFLQYFLLAADAACHGLMPRAEHVQRSTPTRAVSFARSDLQPWAPWERNWRCLPILSSPPFSPVGALSALYYA